MSNVRVLVDDSPEAAQRLADDLGLTLVANKPITVGCTCLVCTIQAHLSAFATDDARSVGWSV
jgi:hypothetical protein